MENVTNYGIKPTYKR